MADFFRFPHTPHLAWLGAGRPRADKVLSSAERESLLTGPVAVEEKVDGANVGISFDISGVRVQNRGGFLRPDSGHSQFDSLWPWLAPREARLRQALGTERLLFGEWCAAVHSIEYSALPDWFIGFDVYEREEGVFWDSSRRDALLDTLGLFGPPRLGRGIFTVSDLQAMLGQSRLGTGPMEGLVIRKEEGGATVGRAKLVRREFTQAIDEHWSRKPRQRNRLLGWVSTGSRAEPFESS